MDNTEYYLGLIEQSELEQTIFENILEYASDSKYMEESIIQEAVNFSKMSIKEFESCLAKAAELIKNKYDTNVRFASDNNNDKIVNQIFPEVNVGVRYNNKAVRVVKKISGVTFIYYKNKNSQGQYIPLKPYVFFYNNPNKGLCFLHANKYLKKVCKK